jgi:hypothetical protein
MRGALETAKAVVAGIGHCEKRVADGESSVKYFVMQSISNSPSKAAKKSRWTQHATTGAEAQIIRPLDAVLKRRSSTVLHCSEAPLRV